MDGLAEAAVGSVAEALEVFSRGEGQRTTAETALNERSSRSHAIFRVAVEHDFAPEAQNAPGLRILKRAVVNFVDLAGSERQFGADADRLKETCQINKSLVVLSSVINNMGDGGKRFMHVRDSK